MGNLEINKLTKAVSPLRSATAVQILRFLRSLSVAKGLVKRRLVEAVEFRLYRYCFTGETLSILRVTYRLNTSNKNSIPWLAEDRVNKITAWVPRRYDRIDYANNSVTALAFTSSRG